jgi:hypothetical protein
MSAGRATRVEFRCPEPQSVGSANGLWAAVSTTVTDNLTTACQGDVLSCRKEGSKEPPSTAYR